MANLGAMTHGVEPLKKLKDMKMNKIVLRKLGLIVRLDSIQLDDLT